MLSANTQRLAIFMDFHNAILSLSGKQTKSSIRQSLFKACRMSKYVPKTQTSHVILYLYVIFQHKFYKLRVRRTAIVNFYF